MSEQQFDESMGAVRIFSNGKGKQHRGGDLWIRPPGMPAIKASKYVKKGMFSFNRASLAEVVASGTLDKDLPILIIVHMYTSFLSDSKTQTKQADVIRAAIKRSIPIYVVQKVAPEENPKDFESTKATLPDALQNAVGTYERLFYYAEMSLGNALEGRKSKNGKLLRDQINHGFVQTAIVIGQSYGQCVDSTILGMVGVEYKDSGKVEKYSLGLLDIGIDVVTSRDVLEPPPREADTPSQYFSFEMGYPIIIGSKSTTDTTKEKSVLDVPISVSSEHATTAPLKAPTDAAIEV